MFSEFAIPNFITFTAMYLWEIKAPDSKLQSFSGLLAHAPDLGVYVSLSLSLAMLTAGYGANVSIYYTLETTTH